MFSPVKLTPFEKHPGSLLKYRPHAAGHCDCPAHRNVKPDAARRASWWSALLPILACALCPACISAWAPLLATAGLGLALTESHHTALLLGAIAVSLVVAVWRARRTQAWVPLLLTTTGGASMLAGHLLDDNVLLAGLGALCFLSAAALGVLPSRSASRRASPPVPSGQVET
jgi:FtsH-binding integral membrane protein